MVKILGGFMGRNGALRGGGGDALRGLPEPGLTRKLEPGLGNWDNTLGLDMRGEGTEEGEDDCATLSQSEKEGRLCGSERQGGGSSQLCLFFFAGFVWKDLRWHRWPQVKHNFAFTIHISETWDLEPQRSHGSFSMTGQLAWVWLKSPHRRHWPGKTEWPVMVAVRASKGIATPKADKLVSNKRRLVSSLRWMPSGREFMKSQMVWPLSCRDIKWSE